MRIKILITILMLELLMVVTGVWGYRVGSGLGHEEGKEKGAQRALNIVVTKILSQNPKLVIEGPITVSRDCNNATFILWKTDDSSLINIGGSDGVTLNNINAYGASNYGYLVDEN